MWQKYFYINLGPVHGQNLSREVTKKDAGISRE